MNRLYRGRSRVDPNDSYLTGAWRTFDLYLDLKYDFRDLGAISSRRRTLAFERRRICG